MSKSMKVLVLAGVLSIAAASAVQAGGKVTCSDFHASAAPACDTDKCPVLATEGPPSGPGDNNGRSAGIETAHPVLAEDGPPGTAGDRNGRSQASNTSREWHPVLAASKPNSGGNINI